MTLFAFVFGVIIAVEIILATSILLLRRSCPWLITKSDASPKLNRHGLQSFIDHGWDAALGWVRKPNTSGTETGRHGVATAYHIDESGARLNPGFQGQPPAVLAFGDSYTFSRQVDDQQTWAHFLSKALNKNVANFGVGNYGFDQALLRLEREYDAHPAQVVIIGVVPETMSRLHAYWKHYSEYGNTFAFKPRFVLQGGALVLKPNLIDTADKFNSIDAYQPALAADDYFYETKFKRDMLDFPYSLSVFKNPKRTFGLILAALTDRIGISSDAAFMHVMRRNIQMTRDLYANAETSALFEALVRRFVQFCTSRGAMPILLMMPQRMDIERIKKGDHYYHDFMQAMSKHLTVVDAANALLSDQDIDSLYINDHYGGHLSIAGNQRVADLLTPICSALLQNIPRSLDTE